MDATPDTMKTAATQPISPAADVMARTMAGEARGEGDDGMRAVGHVIMNRLAKATWYGRSVREVCMKPGQFSCWNRNDPNRAIIEGLCNGFSIYRRAVALAVAVIGGQLADTTKGATHYYAEGSEIPAWAEGRTPCARIGHHIFFNDIP